MIFNLNSDEPMGESTQVAYYELDKALDEEINDFENFIQNTDYAYELEENMKNCVKKGIIAYLKKKGIVFDETDDKAIWKALSNCYKCYGFDNDKKRWNSISKNVKNWIKNGKPGTNIDDRKNLYDLCMVLDMNIDETKEFFSKYFYTLPFNYKNRIDSVYYYCIKNHKNYSDTQKLLKIAKKSSNIILDNMDTDKVYRQLSEIDNDDEFAEYLSNNCYSAEHQMQTAKRRIIGMIGSTSISEIIYNIYGFSIQMYRIEKVTSKDKDGKKNKDKNKKRKGLSKGNFPESFIKSIPQDNELCKIQKGVIPSYEAVRKMIILLNFYNTYKETDDVLEEKTIEEIHAELRDFYDETSSILIESGFSKMYYKHPFDWLILYCANTSNPLESFRELIEKRYLDVFDEF